MDVCAACGKTITMNDASCYVDDPCGGDFGKSFHSKCLADLQSALSVSFKPFAGYYPDGDYTEIIIADTAIYWVRVSADIELGYDVDSNELVAARVPGDVVVRKRKTENVNTRLIEKVVGVPAKPASLIDMFDPGCPISLQDNDNQKSKC